MSIRKAKADMIEDLIEKAMGIFKLHKAFVRRFVKHSHNVSVVEIWCPRTDIVWQEYSITEKVVVSFLLDAFLEEYHDEEYLDGRTFNKRLKICKTPGELIFSGIKAFRENIVPDWMVEHVVSKALVDYSKKDPEN